MPTGSMRQASRPDDRFFGSADGFRSLDHPSSLDSAWQGARRRYSRHDTGFELDRDELGLHGGELPCHRFVLIKQVSFLMFHHVTGVPFEQA